MKRTIIDYLKTKYIRKITAIVIAAAVFGAGIRMLDYMYVTEDDWGRILWHHYYEEQGKIDNLCLGTSHIYMGLDAYRLDDLNGKYNFNMCSSAQSLRTSYYLLREAARDNKLQQVYVELYYVCDDWGLAWGNIDYMKWSANKLAYMLSEGIEKAVNESIPFSRYRGRLGDWNYIKATMENKKTEAFRSYQYRHDFEEENWYYVYLGRGTCECTRKFRDQERCYKQDVILDEHPMGDAATVYLRKIIEFCQAKEIPVTLFSTPIDNLQLVSAIDYDKYVDAVKIISKEYNVPFYDFNLAKDEYLPIHYNDYYMDIHHLNRAGNEMFTDFFFQVVSGEESENAEYFHDSYANKLRETAPAVYGIYYKENLESEESTKTMWVASNREEGMEYRIILTPYGGEQYMVQDFEGNKKFETQLDEHGVCTVVMRTSERPDEVQTIETNY